MLKKHWPIFLALAMFIGVSFLVRSNIFIIQAIFQSTPPAMSGIAFVFLGIVMVVIPTASILPFMPLAVAAWGWPMAAALTLVAWVLGGQILFEVSRMFGKPLMTKVFSASQLQTFSRLVQGKGMMHSILVRLIVHGDVISYAFGLFTDIRRMEFCLVSAIGVAPAAVLYAYFGSLTFSVQLGIIAAVLLVLGVYWVVQSRYPRHLLPSRFFQVT